MSRLTDRAGPSATVDVATRLGLIDSIDEVLRQYEGVHAERMSDDHRSSYGQDRSRATLSQCSSEERSVNRLSSMHCLRLFSFVASTSTRAENRSVNPTMKSVVPRPSIVAELSTEKKVNKVTSSTPVSVAKTSSLAKVNKPLIHAPVKPATNKRPASPTDDRLSDEECTTISFVDLRTLCSPCLCCFQWFSVARSADKHFVEFCRSSAAEHTGQTFVSHATRQANECARVNRHRCSFSRARPAIERHNRR
jgi:hypothetical protein